MTWLLGSECDLLLADESVDEGRLSHVGPANDGELWAIVLGTVARPRATLYELDLFDLRVPRVGSNHDVGTRQNHRLSNLVEINPRWDKQILPHKIRRLWSRHRCRFRREGGGARRHALYIGRTNSGRRATGTRVSRLEQKPTEA